MARTVAQAFNQFSARTALTQSQRASIASRVVLVRQRLVAQFPTTSNMPLLSVDLMGSADRSTVSAPPEDVDVLALFDHRQVWPQYASNSKNFLYRVRDAYKGNRIKVVGARGQVVRLFYTSGPYVDVAPVFRYANTGYVLPRGDGGWIPTNPDQHRIWVAHRHKALNNQLTRFVRMLKQWNRAHSQRLSSFHLEVMVGSMFTMLSNNSRSNSALFFAKAAGFLDVEDPAGQTGKLTTGMTPLQRFATLQSFKAAAERAASAQNAERRGNPKEAIRLWRIVFGDSFPAFG